MKTWLFVFLWTETLLLLVRLNKTDAHAKKIRCITPLTRILLESNVSSIKRHFKLWYLEM